jgi:CRP/FNR family transcriptional regulator
MINIEEKVQQASLFAKLAPKDITQLLAISKLKELVRGEIIFYKGDAPKELFVLLDGSAKVYKHNQKGGEIVMKHFHAVSLIAEIANLEQIPYPSNCMAEVDSLVLAIDYAKFEEQFLKNSDFLLLFVKSLTHKVFNLERIIHSNITLDASSRVAKFLYENEEEFYAKTNVEIAQSLNITPETLSRVLKKFKNAEILILRDGVYRVDESQRDALEELFEA